MSNEDFKIGPQFDFDFGNKKQMVKVIDEVDGMRKKVKLAFEDAQDKISQADEKDALGILLSRIDGYLDAAYDHPHPKNSRLPSNKWAIEFFITDAPKCLGYLSVWKNDALKKHNGELPADQKEAFIDLRNLFLAIRKHANAVKTYWTPWQGKEEDPYK